MSFSLCKKAFLITSRRSFKSRQMYFICFEMYYNGSVRPSAYSQLLVEELFFLCQKLKEMYCGHRNCAYYQLDSSSTNKSKSCIDLLRIKELDNYGSIAQFVCAYHRQTVDPRLIYLALSFKVAPRLLSPWLEIFRTTRRSLLTT